MKLLSFTVLLAMMLSMLAACTTSAAVTTTTTPPATTSEPEPDQPDGPVVYSVFPEMVWAYATKENSLMTFKLGDGVYEFSFRPVDISEMKYLEFDLYLPSIAKIKKITEDTQFEITSSGTCDREEYNWGGFTNGILKGQKLEKGWNHIKVTLPNMPDVDKTKVDYIRWYFVSPRSSIDGCKVANLRFTVDGSVDPKREQTIAEGFLVDTVYPTNDVVIATADITKEPYNADNTGTTDVTAIINQALRDVSASGGGTVWMPVGKYLVSGTISIPAYCTLRGDWQDPDVGTDYGTVILANVRAGGAVNNALFLISGSAGVNGMTVYYPNQSLDNVKNYPFTFYTTGAGASYMLASVTNCTVLNGYQGIGACVSEGNAHEQFSIDNVKGTFLRTAAEVYNQADVGTWKSVTVSSKYWEECSLSETPVDATALRSYIRENGIGLILGDLEWTEFVDLQVSGYKYGIQIVKGHRIEFAGSIYDASVTDCEIGLKVDSIDTRWGMLISNSTIEGSDCSIENNTGGVVKGVNLKLNGPTRGIGAITYEDSAIAEQVKIDYAVSYKKPVAKLYQYTGTIDYTADCSAKIQALLDEAGKTGGVVYLPGGIYRLDNPITVPAGVELRGAAGSPTRETSASADGTVLLVYYGDGSKYKSTDQALITLGKDAGVNGIRILYPENGPLDRNRNTTYAIRGTASGVYVVNCSIAAAAYGVDFTDCDNHYIKKLVTFCYITTMTLGGDNGVVEGCLQNGTVLVRMSSSLRVHCKNMIDEADIFTKLYDPIARRQCNYIVIKEGSGQVIYNTFTYGCKNFITNNGGVNVSVVNVGADNIGGTLFEQTDGSMTVLCAMRYNGTSYTHKGGTLNLYARLSINEKNEATKEFTK